MRLPLVKEEGIFHCEYGTTQCTVFSEGNRIEKIDINIEALDILTRVSFIHATVRLANLSYDIIAAKDQHGFSIRKIRKA